MLEQCLTDGHLGLCSHLVDPCLALLEGVELQHDGCGCCVCGGSVSVRFPSTTRAPINLDCQLAREA
jgi:hypothetical protein